ncbi:MAG: hypothetical protein ACREBG_14815 [Pyrinomonadaceae bacterium]
MKRVMTIALLLAVAMVAMSIPAWRQTIRVGAQEEDSVAAVARGRALTLFGMIGLARGQTARLNVVNLRSVPATDQTADQVPQLLATLPCHVRLRFLDQRGNIVARSAESILPGDGAFLDLPFHEAIPPGFEGRRFQIRAIVQVLSRSENARRCATISSVEIFDNETGRTTAIYPEPPR